MKFAKSLKSSDYKDIVSIFNAENAKLVSFVIAVWLIVFHMYFYLNYGSDRCEWILKLGRPVSSDLWQPYGCMMHSYTSKDTKLCMNYIAYWGGRNRLVFIGDSRIRQLYYEVLSLFEASPNTNASLKHHDQEYFDEKIALELIFRWQPMVNEYMYYDFKSWVDTEKHNRPTLVVIGSGTWTIKENNGSIAARANFRANLTTVMPLIEKLHPSSPVIWMMQEDVIESLLAPNRSMITNEQISLYNSAVLELFRYSSASIWSSNRLISQAYPNFHGDGLHLSQNALRLNAQLLLNYYCNRNLNHQDATCCRTPETMSLSQMVIGLCFGLVVVCATIIAISWKITRSDNGNGHLISIPSASTTSQPHMSWLPSFFCTSARFSLVMVYMFMCDRTDFFMRENKQSGLVNFFLPLIYTLALGIFFTERLEGRAAGFLNRYQTEEWKGWMQLTILLYHLTGASSVVPVYTVVRALVSAYVFLNAYAHTTYFLSGGSFGLHRICKQLFRLNFLAFMMCLTMNRPYMFYYFVPLITFWYLVVFFFFSIPPRPYFVQDLSSANGNYSVLIRPLMNALIRIFLMFGFITLLHYSDSLFNQIFLWAPIKFLFVTSDDSLHEWRFRWEVDRFSAISGCILGLGAGYLRQRSLLPDSDAVNCRPLSALFATLGSVATLVGFTVWSLLCSNKMNCNTVHPWIVGPVVLSYVLLRNVPSAIRSRYSSFLAWFGHISLELFLAQYHIWLASDTRGVLVLIPNYPALNVIITSFIFVCASHELHLGTARLADLLIPDSTHLLIRNVVLFSLSLLLGANFHLFMPRANTV